MTNPYSETWFRVFLDSIHPAQTENELAFVIRHLPLPRFGNVVDLCCGSGQHARLLADQGYRVVGVDRSGAALERARLAGAEVTYVESDMRDLAALPGPVDGLVCL